MRARNLSVSVLLILTGCVQTSDLYAVRQWTNPTTLQPDDRPRINSKELEAKASFVDFVKSECSAVGADATDTTFASNPWARKNSKTAFCVERIAAYAADQCVMITRRQNVVAGDANLALGAVTLGSGAAALYYAVKGPSEKDAEASLASAATASNTSRGFLPTTVSVKITDILGSALTYAEYEGMGDPALESALSYIPRDDHGVRTKAAAEDAARGMPSNEAADNAMIKLARVHDAVFAACGANAYGIRPAAKPYK